MAHIKQTDVFALAGEVVVTTDLSISDALAAAFAMATAQ